jgi:hypothetical protein
VKTNIFVGFAIMTKNVSQKGLFLYQTYHFHIGHVNLSFLCRPHKFIIYFLKTNCGYLGHGDIHATFMFDFFDILKHDKKCISNKEHMHMEKKHHVHIIVLSNIHVFECYVVQFFLRQCYIK